jgi:hypothetical protein
VQGQVSEFHKPYALMKSDVFMEWAYRVLRGTVEMFPQYRKYWRYLLTSDSLPTFSGGGSGFDFVFN